MILVDSSVWIDHLRHGNDTLAELLQDERVLSHPCVIGELSLGDARQRETIKNALQGMAQCSVADSAEVLLAIERHALFGCGIGYVDAQLLAAVLLEPGALLWTLDLRLQRAAARLGLAFGAHH